MKTSPKSAFTRLVAGAAAVLLASFALAQNAPQGYEGPPLYKVEVIVFANTEADPNEEYFARSAQRAAMSGVEGRREVATFDFTPLIGSEEPNESGDGFGLDVFDPAADDAADREAGRDIDRSDLGGSRDDAAAGRSGGPTDTPQALPGADTAADPARTADASGDAAGGAASQGTDETDVDLETDPGAVAEALPPDPLGDRPGLATTTFRFRLLQPEELELTNALRRLERLDAYRPLLHGGWIQEGLPENQATPFDLAYLGATNPAGTVRLHVSRFLHLTLDLDYRPFTAFSRARQTGPETIPGEPDQETPGAETETAIDEPGISRPEPGEAFGERGPFGAAALPPLSDVTVGDRYPLRVERRVRSGEVHYFDHPFFGVIVVVEPYEPPPEASESGLRPAA